MGFPIKQYYGMYPILTNNKGHIKLKHFIGILYNIVQYSNNMLYQFSTGWERIKIIIIQKKRKFPFTVPGFSDLTNCLVFSTEIQTCLNLEKNVISLLRQ
jgi:hypothetical protein